MLPCLRPIRRRFHQFRAGKSAADRPYQDDRNGTTRKSLIYALHRCIAVLLRKSHVDAEYRSREYKKRKTADGDGVSRHQ